MHQNISYFTAADGLPIRYGIWRSPGPEFRGSIVYLGGRAEFIEKNEETIRLLRDRRFDVYALDWRGQGLSGRLLDDRHKGYVGRFRDYLDDLEYFIDRFLPSDSRGPTIMLGHSMGGHVALHYLHAHPGRMARAVLSAPMIDINTSPLPETLVRVLARTAVCMGMGKHYIFGAGGYEPGKKVFAGNPLTGDPVRFFDESRQIAKQPDLALGGATFRWLHEAFVSIDRLKKPDFAAAIKTPVLMVAGDKDRVVCRRAMRRFCRMLPNCRFVEINGGYHEILKETDAVRHEFWRHFDAFVR